MLPIFPQKPRPKMTETEFYDCPTAAPRAVWFFCGGGCVAEPDPPARPEILAERQAQPQAKRRPRIRTAP